MNINDEYFKKVMTNVILVLLAVLSFFLLKPILLSIIIGCILAFMFNPIHSWLNKYIHSKNLSVSIVCLLLATIIILPFWFLTPIFIDQSINLYISVQNIDLVTPLKSFFPSLFSSETFSSQIGQILSSFLTKTANSITNVFSNILLNFPTLSLQFLVVLFTFFFVLRDGENLLYYIRSLLPFSKNVEDQLFEYSKSITSSVIYGQVVLGLFEGIIVGIGLFIFNIPNALLLTLLACLTGILPIIGTTIVWFPVVIYLILAGQVPAAFGLIGFGIVAYIIDNIVKPFIVSKRTSMHSAVILIGMIGGVFFFGILGFILGPLILAYLLILIEIYRNKKLPGVFIQEPYEITS